MSVVTSVVMTTSLMDWDAVEQVDVWLNDHGYGALREISSQAMEVYLYAAAYNHFPAEEFGPFVAALPWRIPEEFCLLLQTDQWPVEVIRGGRAVSSND